MKNKPIYVTQPSVPGIKDLKKMLKVILKSHVLTNMGPIHNQLESKLEEYLGVKYISLFSNGTLALMTALQALEIKGEVITTPYSFVATSHALWWNGIKPVFVDVEDNSCNIDANKIESAITERTSAIMPVHVYGIPCNIDKIKSIADKYGLKVIYDAAHAFGVKVNDQSVLNFGDLSILSFHATKVFNTVEGGAIVSHNKEMKRTIDYLKNFGFENEITITVPGINAKMNEIQAAFGLLNLKNVDSDISKRKIISEFYQNKLREITGIRLLKVPKNVFYNYSYFPIFVENNFSVSRDQLYDILKREDIYSRRYFYPLISSFKPYSLLESASTDNLTNSNHSSDSVLCLPLYPNLSLKSVNRITEIIHNYAK